MPCHDKVTDLHVHVVQLGPEAKWCTLLRSMLEVAAIASLSLQDWLEQTGYPDLLQPHSVSTALTACNNACKAAISVICSSDSEDSRSTVVNDRHLIRVSNPLRSR